MKTVKTKWLILFGVLFFCFCGSNPVTAQGSVSDGLLRYRTIRDGCPLRLFLNEAPHAFIPANMIVVVQREFVRSTEQGRVTFFWVRIPGIDTFGSPLQGWMQAADLHAMMLKVEAQYKEQKDNIEADKVNESGNKRLPFATREEFKEINQICDENNKLDEDKRLPEPLFARAKYREQAGEYVLAISDYLEGLSYVRNLSPTGYQYVGYEKYFEQIKQAIDNATVQPYSVVRMGRAELDSAGSHFSRGYTHFWDGKLSNALHEFDNAIKIAPNVPIFWYYRGLTYWKLRDKHKATFNLLTASMMEKNAVEDQLEKSRERAQQRGGTEIWEDRYALQWSVSQSLRRFQGNDRMFLEQIRLGDPSNLILKEFLR